MKISTEIASPSKIVGEEKAVELVAKAGFDAWDFSMCSPFEINWNTGELLRKDHPLNGPDYLKFARRLKQIGLDNGIVCNQSHAPFPLFIPAYMPYIKKAIECTAEAGGEICIVHPGNDWSPEKNAEVYHELLPFAKECGVKIATENMWNWDNEKGHSCFAACATPESFKAHIDAVNDEFLVACVDIGHAEMKGSDTTAADMIKTLKDSVQALHIHDNDKLHDNHQIPFSMDIDYVPVIKALKEIGYKGYFTLESNAHIDKGNYTPETVLNGLIDLKNAVRRLADMFENPLD